MYLFHEINSKFGNESCFLKNSNLKLGEKIIEH